MTDSTLTGDEKADEAIIAAIEENPEEVAAFVQRLGLLNQLLDATELATAALDDQMVEQLGATSATLGEAVDGLATDETVRLAEAVGTNADDMATALERIARLEADGDLETLVGAANTVSLAADAMDDDIVMSLGSTASSLGEVADTAADPDTREGTVTLLEAIGSATTDGPPDRVGALGLVRALRDENVQRGLGFLVAIARATGKHLPKDDRTDGGPDSE
jgi:uncharacterized protein YjgD (DUF1641 family)